MGFPLPLSMVYIVMETFDEKIIETSSNNRTSWYQRWTIRLPYGRMDIKPSTIPLNSQTHTYHVSLK